MDDIGVTKLAITLDPGYPIESYRVQNDREVTRARLEWEPCPFNVLDMRPHP